MLPLAGGQPFPFAATPDEERNAKMSPDGRYVAYTFVQGANPRCTSAVSGDRREVADSPATADSTPLGARTARTLFYASADRRSWRSRSAAGGRVCGGQPRIAVDARIETRERTSQGSAFAVSPDGRASS